MDPGLGQVGERETRGVKYNLDELKTFKFHSLVAGKGGGQHCE